MKRYNQAFLSCLCIFVFLLTMTIWYQHIAQTTTDPFATTGFFTLHNAFFSWLMPYLIGIFKVAMVYYWCLMAIMVLKKDWLIKTMDKSATQKKGSY